jgi:uncharacterized RDD family membrane protein YckC
VVFTGRVQSELVSGEAVELEIRVARVGSRVLALLLDILIETLLFMILGTVVPLVILLITRFENFDAAILSTIMIVVLVIVVIGYPVTMETLAGGRTVGKLALGLRVVRDDGGPIRFRHALTRSLVGVAVEWPGLIMPLVTWVVSLTTMLANPGGKRLGDLAAGTMVIHDRTPASWGWVPAMPPQLGAWASTLDLTGLPDDLALAVRHFLARNRRLAEPFRSRLGYALAAEVSARTTPPPPFGVPGWVYLAAVIAERHRRSAGRLVLVRHAAAQVWPGLGQPVSPAAPLRHPTGARYM